MNYTDVEPMLIVLATVSIVFVAVYLLQIRGTLRQRQKLPELRQKVIEMLKGALGDFPVPELALLPLKPQSVLGFIVAVCAVIAVPCLILYAVTFAVVRSLCPDQLIYVSI